MRLWLDEQQTMAVIAARLGTCPWADIAHASHLCIHDTMAEVYLI